MPHISYARRSGSRLGQHEHFARALEDAKNTYDSYYYMLLEDDFPLCDNKWPTIEGTMAKAFDLGLRPCGFFFGTGGRYGSLCIH